MGIPRRKSTVDESYEQKTKDRIDDNLSHKNKELKITKWPKIESECADQRIRYGLDDRKAVAVTHLYDKSTESVQQQGNKS